MDALRFPGQMWCVIHQMCPGSASLTICMEYLHMDSSYLHTSSGVVLNHRYTYICQLLPYIVYTHDIYYISSGDRYTKDKQTWTLTSLKRWQDDSTQSCPGTCRFTLGGEGGHSEFDRRWGWIIHSKKDFRSIHTSLIWVRLTIANRIMWNRYIV